MNVQQSSVVKTTQPSVNPTVHVIAHLPLANRASSKTTVPASVLMLLAQMEASLPQHAPASVRKTFAKWNPSYRVIALVTAVAPSPALTMSKFLATKTTVVAIAAAFLVQMEAHKRTIVPALAFKAVLTEGR